MDNRTDAERPPEMTPAQMIEELRESGFDVDAVLCKNREPRPTPSIPVEPRNEKIEKLLRTHAR
jgi:hypothetical protein